MANREKGEVSVVVDGVTYTLVLNMSAQIAAEAKAEELGLAETFAGLAKLAETGSVRAIRLMFWAMFQKYHSGLSMEEVTAVIDMLGMAGMSRLMGAATLAMTPDPEDVSALGGSGSRPRKARVNGSGGRSTSPAAARA